MHLKLSALLFGCCLFLTHGIFAQVTPSDRSNHLYRPQQPTNKPLEKQPDTIAHKVGQNLDLNIDTTQTVNQDSLAARLKFVQDSLAIREAFVRDSIIKRQAFVRDSIMKRKRRIDSLNFLKVNLPKFLEASLKTNSDDVFLKAAPLKVIGDSVLSDYTVRKLIFNLEKPYTPWELTFNLSDKPIIFKVDTLKKTIKAIKAGNFSHLYNYNPSRKVLRIDERSIILNNRYGKFFNLPVDSVFYNARGQITKIKRYDHYYKVTPTYQKGAFLFRHLTQVKQYSYLPNGNASKIETVNFCERWRESMPKKVCIIVTYELSGGGNSYTLKRNNDPANIYSDGQFTFNFENSGNLKTVEFKNTQGNEDWETTINLNENGRVKQYIFKNKGKITRSLLIYYYDNDPKAKHKLETVSCFFEDDLISYKQVNNTTGKERVRDRLTMEWSDWK